MKHIRTNTDYHYISTVWTEATDHWETMVFEKTNDEIDWSGVGKPKFTCNEERAIANHCNAILVVAEWERKVGK